MNKGGLTRALLIGLMVFLAFTFLPKLFGKSGSTELQPLKYEGERAAAEGKLRSCELWGPRFHAQLSTQGADLTHFWLTTAKYQKDGKPIDLSTTPDVPMRRSLRMHWRHGAAASPDDPSWQLDYDLVNYELGKNDGKSCEFIYRDAKVELRKLVRVTERPYELAVDATITNLSKEKRRHALTVDTVTWRTAKEVEGHMFRVSPFVTFVECVPSSGDVTRLTEKDFEPSNFQKDHEFTPGPLNPGDWYQAEGRPSFAAVSDAYFSHVLAPMDGRTPACQLQVEERWDARAFKAKADDPNAGGMYRARLAYDASELEPGKSARYELMSYAGPKERDLLAGAGGGKHDLSELINLGFFTGIAKILVRFLLAVHSVVPNWGIAIIVLTFAARMLLFPLSWPSIKSMVKMRELKPELDALNAKFKDDAQARGLAQMELWRKHNVNPIKGCLPQLASMPVWFALYTALQTAVELYNIPFLWFPDLSAPDPYYILPFVIGGTSFVQQLIMPMQGDPTQAKMMRYFMPAMFTVFMLFLPSGLGVYMFTNSLLGILQQQVVERHVRNQSLKSQSVSGGAIEVKTKEEKPVGKGDSDKSRPLLDKGKA